MSELKPGVLAPDFTLPSSSGSAVTLSDFYGKKNVVLYFYPKDNTPGCTREACGFRDIAKEFQAAGAEIFGVSCDSIESHLKFSDKFKLSFPLLSDSDKAVAKRWGVYKKKQLYGRSFMGIERTTFLIDRKGIVRHIFPKVKVDGHPAEVLEVLRSLK